MSNYAERIEQCALADAGAVRLANATTGAEDTNVPDAIASLIAGYGGGGAPVVIEFDYTLNSDITSTTPQTETKPMSASQMQKAVSIFGAAKANDRFIFYQKVEYLADGQFSVMYHDFIYMKIQPSGSTFASFMIAYVPRDSEAADLTLEDRGYFRCIFAGSKINPMFYIVKRANSQIPKWNAGTYRFTFEFIKKL